MKRYLMTTWTLCTMLTKRWFRDPVALFFTFLFPLIFLLIFGSLFRTSDVSFDIAVMNHSDSAVAAQFAEQLEQSEVVAVNADITDTEEAKELMGRGELASFVELPADFGVMDEAGVPRGNVVVYYEEANPESGQTIAGVVQQMLEGFTTQFVEVDMPMTVAQQPTRTADLTQFDYMFAGLLGFTILVLGIFVMANTFPADKKTGSLRRLRASPLRTSQLVFATALEYMLIGLIALALMMIVGLTLFDFDMRGNYVTLALFCAAGIACLFGFGLAVAGWARNENQSAPLSNIVAIPMMFLSGVFFPIFFMPDWLQTVAQLLPLTPVIEGIRLIVTENASLLDLGSQLGIIAIWSVIIYAIAFKFFRWE